MAAAERVAPPWLSPRLHSTSIRHHATRWRSSVAALALACLVGYALSNAHCRHHLSALLRQNATLESALKNASFCLNYVGIVTKGELSLRLTSLLATGCSHATLWTKWPHLNWVQIALQSGLLLRALRLTCRVWEKQRFRLTAQELALYRAHLESHGLSQREFYALLQAGAEWRTAGGAGELIQEEGSLVHRFVLLHAGTCAVFSGGTRVSTLGPGDLVGEAAFARAADSGEGRRSHRSSSWAKVEQMVRSRASATVVSAGPVEYLAWPMGRLEEALEKSSSAKACLMTMIAAALAQKLRKATKRIEAAEVARIALQAQKAPASSAVSSSSGTSLSELAAE
ncbi:hypothetical protein AB1Y20_014046 [Prymnesium parvum]|uniref:Cyclic nucleotide-binding domain-containing protein n=1 Tax=Prymnesium parvum TaxID=97485 RepID=A0AB34IH94_PRYPA